MTGLIGAVLALVLVVTGFRLIAGADNGGQAAGRLFGVVLLALVAGPCIAAVSSALNNAPGYFNNDRSGAGAFGTIMISALLGVVIVAGVLQYVRHRRSLDAWLRHPPTSRKKRVE